MSTHPMVVQLRFTRMSFLRAIEGISDEDARRRLMPMNCISWCVGHLANQEQRYWVQFARDKIVAPGLYELVGYGKPASTPPLDDMLAAWKAVTQAADPFLDTLDSASLQSHLERYHKNNETIGTLLQRNIYHYWYHTGEVSAIRQMLGHQNLAEFVGEMSSAPYTPEG
jgi:uncharacterized damage-inducible protein DinB